MSKGSLKYANRQIFDIAVQTPTASHLLNILSRLHRSFSILTRKIIPANNHITNPGDYTTPTFRPARRTLNRRGSEEPAKPSDTTIIIIRIELLIVFVDRREGL